MLGGELVTLQGPVRGETGFSVLTRCHGRAISEQEWWIANAAD